MFDCHPMTFQRTLTIFLTLSFVLLIGENLLHAQFKAEDYRNKAQLFTPLNDGYQNINPTISRDGKNIWFTKLGHSENTGAKLDQDIWASSLKDGKWSKPTNKLGPVNSVKNDLIVGTSQNNFIYVIHFENGSDDGLREIIVYSYSAGVYKEDHRIQLPEFDFKSEYFGFYVSSDESFIIISMKGEYSFGKEDLYVLKKKGTKWSKPMHMGARINTVGFEMSPFMASDNRHLFFSSEGHNSFGSADVFMTVRLDDTWTNWSKPINLGPNINSESFDAYFSLNEARSEAYFASMGENSIANVMRISYEESSEMESVSAHRSASGFLKLEKLPAMSVKLNLLDEDDRVIQSITTNEDGYFNLQSFLPDRNYKIAIDDSVKDQVGKADIYLTNSLGENMVYMNDQRLGIFGFKVLSGQKVRDIENLQALAEKGKVVDKNTKITGRIESYGTLAETIKLKVLDDQNNVVKEVETDNEGFFSFNSDARESSYFLSVDANMSGLVDVYEIYLTNDNPDEDIIVNKTDKHLFEFRTLMNGDALGLQPLQVEDQGISEKLLKKYGLIPLPDDKTGLIGYLRLNQLPMIDAEVKLMDSEDKVMSVVQTDATGRFIFDVEINNGDYKLLLNEEQEADLANSEIFLSKNPGDVLVYLNDERNGVFAFRKLAKKNPLTLHSLRTSTESGKVVSDQKTTLKGKFEYSKLPKDNIRLRLLDEDENIIQITEVNDDGTFEFENYTVNKNYFISVEGPSGLSDIYEVYISGSNRNVLVNRTNRYVFSFKILPTLDILLSDVYASDIQLEAGEVKVEDGFAEFEFHNLMKTDYSALKVMLTTLPESRELLIRIYKRTQDEGRQKDVLTEKDINQVKAAMHKAGLSESDFEIDQQTSDQILIQIKN